jgi:two-component system, NarL family, sensor histidine kinase DegS
MRRMAIPKPQTQEFIASMDVIAAENRAVLERTSQSLEEITLLINQTRDEVERLSQREVQLTNRVREMEANIEAFSRTDIRDLLRASHEVELRLFMMRGQLEQPQEREQNIREYRQKVRLLVEIADGQVAAEEERRAIEDQKTNRLRRRETGDLRPAVSLKEIIQAQEAERLRISRKIVDGPAQTLANIILEAEIWERLIERQPEQCKEELATLRDMTSRALQSSRRMLYELRPVTLKELGVVVALRRYLAEATRPLEISGTVVGPEQDDGLPEVLRIAVYRLMQEMIGAAIETDGVSNIDVDSRFEDAQVIGRVELAARETRQACHLFAMAKVEDIAERLEQLEADLRIEILSDTQARLSLVVPLV